jgi:hypothetical protein
LGAPRRLRITIEMDMASEEHRKLHAKRVMASAEEAIEEAVGSLSDDLNDEDFTVVVDSRIEWAYVWTDRRESYSLDSKATRTTKSPPRFGQTSAVPPHRGARDDQKLAAFDRTAHWDSPAGLAAPAVGRWGEHRNVGGHARAEAILSRASSQVAQRSSRLSAARRGNS